MNPPQTTRPVEGALPSRKPLFAALTLAALVIISFWPVSNASFVHFDDPDYASQNPRVLSGLTFAGVRWAFTTFHAGNWHPLTWISLMADVQLLGPDPAVFHLGNLLWHAANTVLVFFVLRALTGAFWRAVFAAALFAIHPLHVESVAWISERKDVLSTFFLLLTLGAYAKFAGSPVQIPARRGAYGVALVFFALGLMAKPMLVTVPLLLLLLDWWPLNRWSRQAAGGLILEKIPFLMLSALSSAVTVLAQQAGGAVKSLEQFPLSERLGNAAVSFARYLWKTVWPAELAIFYPHPGAWPSWQVWMSVALVGGISMVAWVWRRRWGWLFTGWFWFLGTLVPVLGVVQVGIQSIADRYTYVPLIGIFVAVVWGGAEWMGARPVLRRPLVAAAVLVLIVCAALTWRQSARWLNDETLFSHAIAVTRDNVLAHNNLADYLLRQGRAAEAIPHFQEVTRLQPDYYYAHNNLGSALTQSGRLEEALASIRRAQHLNPHYPLTYLNLGDTLSYLGRFTEAHEAYKQALKLDPKMAAAYNNWAALFFREKRFQEAADRYQMAIQLNPGLSPARVGFARALASAGALQPAATAYLEALKLAPQDPRLRIDYARVLLQTGQTNEAVKELRMALDLDPGHVPAQALLQSLVTPGQPPSR